MPSHSQVVKIARTHAILGSLAGGTLPRHLAMLHRVSVATIQAIADAHEADRDEAPQNYADLVGEEARTGRAQLMAQEADRRAEKAAPKRRDDTPGKPYCRERATSHRKNETL